MSTRSRAGRGSRTDWKKSHEGFIEHLHEGCRAQNGTFVPAEAFAPALASGMAAAVGALRALEPDWPVLWSPSARENPGHDLDRAAFRAAAAAFHAAVGLDEIHVQDAVGKASALMTNGTIQYMTGCEHAAAIVEVLASLGRPAAAVNMELFVRQREHFGPEAHHRTVVGDPLEHARRRACYLGRGVDLGVSWEALWYRRSLYTDVAWAGAESVGGGADPVCPAG